MMALYCADLNSLQRRKITVKRIINVHFCPLRFPLLTHSSPQKSWLAAQQDTGKLYVPTPMPLASTCVRIEPRLVLGRRTLNLLCVPPVKSTSVMPGHALFAQPTCLFSSPTPGLPSSAGLVLVTQQQTPNNCRARGLKVLPS